GSTASAARFALPLLGAAVLLLWIERQGRRGRAHESGRGRWRPLREEPLAGPSAWLASGFCLMLLVLGLLLPVGWLIWHLPGIGVDWSRLARAATHSLSLGVAGALVTVMLATMLALGGRRAPLLVRLASFGYATPGAVMAIGLLAPAGVIWNLAPASGMAIALTMLIFAYSARLMAAALEPIDAGLTRVTPSMVQAARTLGRSEGGASLSVELPIARGALFTAGLIVFI